MGLVDVSGIQSISPSLVMANALLTLFFYQEPLLEAYGCRAKKTQGFYLTRNRPAFSAAIVALTAVSGRHRLHLDAKG